MLVFPELQNCWRVVKICAPASTATRTEYGWFEPRLNLKFRAGTIWISFFYHSGEALPA
jgi:hypothetical protein